MKPHIYKKHGFWFIRGSAIAYESVKGIIGMSRWLLARTS